MATPWQLTNSPAQIHSLLAGGFFMFLGIVFGPYIPDDIADISDYVEYVASVRLLQHGENPYDWHQLLGLQQSHGWKEPEADMMWIPPWVFPLLAPLTLVTWEQGVGFWAALQFLSIVSGVQILWKLYGGTAPWGPLAIFLGVVFAPALITLRGGQITGFLVLGLAGFLLAIRQNRPILGGCSLALFALKPHLLLPIGVLIVCDSIVSPRTRRMVVVAAGVLLIAGMIPLLWNPNVWFQWWTAIHAPGDAVHIAPAGWAPPTIGCELRKTFGGELRYQFIPSLVGNTALLIYWFARRKTWDWQTELPRVVLVAAFTTGYGGLEYDLLILLVPVIQVAGWVAATDSRNVRWMSLFVYLLLNALALPHVIPVIAWTPIVAAGCVALGYWTRFTRPVSRTDPTPASPE